MTFKILLSSAIINAEEMFGQYSKGGGAYLPLGLLSIASILIRDGFDVSICDPYAMKMGENAFREFLKKNNFNLIGLGNCYTSMTDNFFATARICKQVLPEALICIGGAHPTIFPGETMEKCEQIDFLVHGEGEISFLKLARAVEKNEKDFSSLPGLVYRSNDGIRINHNREEIKNSDDIPMLPYHLIPMKKYVPPPSNYKKLPTYGMLIQRGCPYKCIYCDNRIHGHKLRRYSVGRVIEEIKFLQEKYGMRGMIFQDSIFTLDRRWVIEFCESIKAYQLNFTWTCYTRADAIDEELCSIMKDAGCWSISLGVESANQESLDLIKKNITLDEIVLGIQAAKKSGMEVILSIILGLPGEDEKMVRNTIDFVKKMDVDIVVFFMPVPFPGTELYDLCKADGGLAPNIQWRDYRQWMDQKNLLYVNPKLGKDKMLELYQYAFRSFYLSPGYILKSIAKIRSVHDIMKYFRGFSSIKQLLAIPLKSPFLSMRD